MRFFRNRQDQGLEDRLRSLSSEPRDEFVRELSSEVRATRIPDAVRSRRFVAVLVTTALMIIPFVAFGGVNYAAASARSAVQSVSKSDSRGDNRGDNKGNNQSNNQGHNNNQGNNQGDNRGEHGDGKGEHGDGHHGRPDDDEYHHGKKCDHGDKGKHGEDKGKKPDHKPCGD